MKIQSSADNLKMGKHSVNYVSFARVFFISKVFPICYNFTLCGFLFLTKTPEITPSTTNTKEGKKNMQKIKIKRNPLSPNQIINLLNILF